MTMISWSSKTQSVLCLVLINAIILSGMAIPIFAQQEKPIVITFGQPNIWSLEQAHYLLARMHRQNLDLQTAALGDLDPNAANASRIDILKTLLSAGVKFDQAVALNNQLLKGDKTFNSNRRQELLGKRSSLQEESTQLARDISALKIAKTNAKTDEERKAFDDQIAAKTDEKTAVDSQLTQTNTELSGLTSTSGDFQKAEADNTFDSTKLTGDLDSLISKVQLINPTIAASLRLENHIQMQYEIIAKQLTLLRDEVGPGERLVFLELPQSINATQDKADNKMAQTWWRIAGYTTVDKEKLLENEIKTLGANIAAVYQTSADQANQYELMTALDKQLNTNREGLVKDLEKQCEQKLEREQELERNKAALEKEKAAKQAASTDLGAAKDAQAGTEAKLAEKLIAKDTADKELAATRGPKNSQKRKLALKKARDAAADAEAAMRAKQKADEKVCEAEIKKDAVEKESAARCKALEHDIDQWSASISRIDTGIKETRETIQRIDDQQIKLRTERAKLSQAFTTLSTKYQKLKLELTKKKIKEQQDRADRLLQGGGANTSEVVTSTIDLLSKNAKGKDSLGFKKAADGNNQTDKDGRMYSDGVPLGEDGRRYVNLDLMAWARDSDKTAIRSGAPPDDQVDKAILRNRAVRTLDIIPRQNAVNVNDTKQRVSKTGIFAAVSFLFGFAGKFTYERQHEQAEQFLNQELFTSGFGKGETDFGWNFYPFAGTKVLAPGIRTTYAVAIIPEDAESLVLKAKGCYFPRKENQPLNYDTAGWDGRFKGGEKAGFCTPQEQVFVLPVPGGSGDGADYYVTGMWFSPHRKPGDRMVASIYGQNFPTQLGILVNGVALTESVGLGQIGIESVLGDKVKENCVGQVCGRFERIDSHQIVISFSMPADFKKTPLLALIGPGKEIELNKLNLSINGTEDAQLDSEWMFGAAATAASRTIDDFKIAPALSPNKMRGVLSGGKFKPSDTIYVNGEVAKDSKTACQRADLCVFEFNARQTDSLTVTVSPEKDDEDSVSRTFANPTTLSIISASVLSSVAGDATHPAVLTVKLDGSGFRESLQVRIVKSDGTADEPNKIVPSSGQMILKIVSPESAVQISVRDPDNNKSVSAVVLKPGG